MFDLFSKILDYLKYSGASICVTINPFHWQYMPKYYSTYEWPNESTKAISWLFLTIRFWIDDGGW